MLPIVLVMGLILLVAGAVVLYAAYPHRGEEVPAAPWLGEAMSRAVEAVPRLEEGEPADRPAPGAHRPDGPTEGFRLTEAPDAPVPAAARRDH